MTLVLRLGSKRLELGWGGDDAPAVLVACDDRWPVADSVPTNVPAFVALVDRHCRTMRPPDNGDEGRDGRIVVALPADAPLAIVSELTGALLSTPWGRNGVAVFSCAQLALMASGRTTGTVINFGSASTRVTAVLEGYSVACARCHIVGCGTDRMVDRLVALHAGVLDRDSGNDILHNVNNACWVALNDEPDVDARAGTVELSDGRLVELCAAARTVPSDVLFGEHALAQRIFEDCIVAAVPGGERPEGWPLSRSDLACNLVLAGAGSMIAGTADGLQARLSQLRQGGYTMVIAPPERSFSVWIGASVASTLNGLLVPRLVTRDAVDECGLVEAVRTRCLM